MGGETLTATHAAADVEIFTIFGPFPAEVVVAALRVKVPRVGFPELVQPSRHHIVVAPQFVAQTQAHEGRVVAQKVEQGEAFVAEELVLLGCLSTDSAPERQLGVQVYSLLIGGDERCLGWCVGVEAEVVDAVFLGDDEDAAPLLHVGGTVGTQGEDAGVVRAAQEGFVPVDHELRPLDGELAHAECTGYAVAAAPSADPCFHSVQVRVELAPELDIFTHWNCELQLVGAGHQIDFRFQPGLRPAFIV